MCVFRCVNVCTRIYCSVCVLLLYGVITDVCMYVIGLTIGGALQLLLLLLLLRKKHAYERYFQHFENMLKSFICGGFRDSYDSVEREKKPAVSVSAPSRSMIRSTKERNPSFCIAVLQSVNTRADRSHQSCTVLTLDYYALSSCRL